MSKPKSKLRVRRCADCIHFDVVLIASNGRPLMESVPVQDKTNAINLRRAIWEAMHDPDFVTDP